MKLNVLITGAHFTPAVAVIEELKKNGDVNIVYVGRKTTQEGDGSESVESKMLPSLGIKFIPIITGRLQRVFTRYTIPSLLKIPIGLLQALYIILFQKPDVILSFGGYVAVPVVIAGWFFSIPIIIHEQTLISGLANKICSIFADKIAVSFQDGEFRNEKVILTGNPIRQDILDLVDLQDKPTKLKGKPVILIMGGNQGAHLVNLAVLGCLEKLKKTVSMIHVTGNNRFGDFERLGKTQDNNYLVKKWIGKDYGEILQKADLVVCRAGINTLTELAVLEKPAIVIPINSKEQKTNARYFEKLGLTKTLPQTSLSGESLLENITKMLKGLNGLREQAKQAKKIIVPDAAKRLALETILLARKYQVKD